MKQALRATRIEMEISYSRYEIKAIIKKQINQRWQQMWEAENKGRHMKYSQKWGKVGTRVEIEERKMCVCGVYVCIYIYIYIFFFFFFFEARGAEHAALAVALIFIERRRMGRVVVIRVPVVSCSQTFRLTAEGLE